MNTNDTITVSPRFITMSASCSPSASCWGTYRRHAVVELEPGFIGRPHQISERAIGIRRIVELWENCCVGRTRKAASHIAATEAQDLCEDLNGVWGDKAQAVAMNANRI